MWGGASYAYFEVADELYHMIKFIFRKLPLVLLLKLATEWYFLFYNFVASLLA